MSESQLLKPSEIKAKVPTLKDHATFHQWDLKLKSQLRICGIVSYLNADTRPPEPFRLSSEEISNLSDDLKQRLIRRSDEIDAEAPPLTLVQRQESTEPRLRQLTTNEMQMWQYWAPRESRTRSAIEDTLDDSIAPLFNHHKSAHEMYVAICAV